MYAIRRPHGDSIAKFYGHYFLKAEIAKIKPGDRLDLLCKDGLNYLVHVKEIDHSSNTCHIHFLKWNTKYDYKGSFRDLYFASPGIYSSEVALEAKVATPKAKAIKKIDDKRYPEDYFSKPQFNWKCSRRDGTEMKDGMFEESFGFAKRPASSMGQMLSTSGLVRVTNDNIDINLKSKRKKSALDEKAGILSATLRGALSQGITNSQLSTAEALRNIGRNDIEGTDEANASLRRLGHALVAKTCIDNIVLALLCSRSID